MIARMLSAASALLLLSGCVPVVSLNPFCPESDSVFDPGLVGRWVNDDGDMSLVFSRSGESGYLISLTAEEDTYQLRGHLLRIDDADLLDLAPLEPDDDSAERFLMHLMPFHTIHRIRRTDNALEFATVDGAWLEEEIEAGQVRIDHVVVDEILVLTGSTEALQSALRRFKEEDEAFPKAGVLRRKP